MIVSGDNVAEFVSRALGFGLCPPYVAIGIERDGRIVAGVLINHYEGADCHISAAGTGWTRAFLRALGIYVYDMLGCERMTMLTEHEQVARYAERLGGKREGLLRSHYGAGRDAIIIGILLEEYLVAPQMVIG